MNHIFNIQIKLGLCCLPWKLPQNQPPPLLIYSWICKTFRFEKFIELSECRRPLVEECDYGGYQAPGAPEPELICQTFYETECKTVNKVKSEKLKIQGVQ